MERDALESREGLPAHLRELADLYPRGMWEGHGNFNALTRFWLDRHVMFRRVSAVLRGEAEAYLDQQREGQEAARRITRLGRGLVGELHMHHGIEDHHYFPRLAAKATRLEAAFALLDRDHHALDARLDAIERAVEEAAAALIAGEARSAVDLLQQETVLLERFLHQHLADEEEIVVPVILEYGGEDLG